MYDVNAYTVSKAFVFYNDCNSIVKMYYLNDVPFTFDELPDGHLWDKDLVEEATKNMPLMRRCLQRIKLFDFGRMSSYV